MLRAAEVYETLAADQQPSFVILSVASFCNSLPRVLARAGAGACPVRDDALRHVLCGADGEDHFVDLIGAGSDVVQPAVQLIERVRICDLVGVLPHIGEVDKKTGKVAHVVRPGSMDAPPPCQWPYGASPLKS